MRKWSLVLVSLWLASPVFALQIKNVVDNETTSAKISSLDVTRIFVEGDRIQSVKGVKGAYTRENDEKKGEIFIQPTSAYQDHAFTLLINTEQGRHFTLLLRPTASPSETLMLVPKGVGHARAAHFEQASSYDLTITHLMRDMKKGTLPEGYVMQAIEGKTTYQFGTKLQVKFKAIYQGLNLRGEILEVKNMQCIPVTLDERTFYKEGVRAISLESIQLPSCGKINLYRVTSYV
jgi:type-F conjugative transfer system secretin TraK